MFGSNAWLVNRLENVVFRPKDPSSDTITADLGICIALVFPLGICLVCVSFDLSVLSTSIPLRNH